MPYIDPKYRLPLEPRTECTAKNSGALNYQITMLIKQYIARNGMGYTACNDVMGALEGCKMEFYRRVVAPYEDKKIKENGDVY